MGVLEKIFAVRKRDPDLPPEIVQVPEKMRRLLTDDNAQNAALPEPIRKVIEAGPAVDQLPGAEGEFGRCVTNPVPVNGPLGELTYLSSLVGASGAALFGHRLGHIGRVDVYETVSTDGKTWDVIFLSYYHPRKSRKAPAGYKIVKAREHSPYITCINFRVIGFPFPMEDAIRECMRRVSGFPVQPPNVAQLLASSRFVRSPGQSARLAGLAALGMEPAPSYRGAGG